MTAQRFPAVMNSLSLMIRFVLKEAENLGMEAKELVRLELVAEEVLVNTINYGFPDQKPGYVEILIAEDENQGIIFVVCDNGVPFDPTQTEGVDTEAPLEERTYGGYGIHLVQTIMDDVQYSRKRDQNILTMKKLHIL